MESHEAGRAGPVPERGGRPSRIVLGSIPRQHRRHRRDRDRRDRRRVHRPHGRGRPAIRRARHQACQDHGARAVLPGRRRLRPLRGAPTSWSTPTATTSTRRSDPRSGRSRSCGARPTSSSATARPTEIEHFSPFKKRMQRFGSAWSTRPPRPSCRTPPAVPCLLPGVAVPAERRHAVQLLHGDDHPGRQPRLRIVSVPIVTNPKTRESRLFKNIWHHMFKSGVGDHPQLPDVPAVHRARHARAPIFGVLGLIPVRAVRRAVAVRRGQRPHPVADLRHRRCWSRHCCASRC